MAIEDLELTYNDPRPLGSSGRFKRSWDTILRNFTKIFDALNLLRKGFGVRAIMESPVAADKKILGFNATGEDLQFGNIVSNMFGAGSTVTWNMQQGTTLAALTDIFAADHTTDNNTVGNEHTALDTEVWTNGNYLVLVIVSTTGAPEQLMIDSLLS